MADESMSAIIFCTIPKGDLPHYSYIFRNPDMLWMRMKNVDCSRLGTMLYLKVQKGKEAMNTAEFQHQIGGIAACMNRLMMDTKGCIQLMSNDA